MAAGSTHPTSLHTYFTKETAKKGGINYGCQCFNKHYKSPSNTRAFCQINSGSNSIIGY